MRSSRQATSPSQRNQVTLAARTAAPSPTALKRTLAATTTGTARSVGIHRVAPLRKPSEREREQGRNKKEERRRDVGFDPVRLGLPGRVLATLIHAATVKPEESFEEPGHSQNGQPEDAEPRKPAGPESAPEAQREGDDQEPVEIRGDPVVEPGLVGGLRADVADVVVGRAEGRGLGEVAEQEAGDEGDRRQQPADSGGAERHPAKSPIP
jgi:hypothetical protein